MYLNSNKSKISQWNNLCNKSDNGLKADFMYVLVCIGNY